MLFNSPDFIVFFIVVFCVYWTLRRRAWQNLWLLGASYVFYGSWSWQFLSLLILSTVIDYACGIQIDRPGDERRRKIVLWISIGSNLAILGTFKYLGFFVNETVSLLQGMGFQANVAVLELVLPIGISFYTFQSMSYVIDVYRRKIAATRDPAEYALYVAFFPQLVAGPIERATHLLPQFRKARMWNTAAFESGLMLAVWGLFKKIAIADNLAPYVDAVYADPSAYSGPVVLTGIVFFAFQIYCDFSGYTDTARGVARMLGFDLSKNFDYPYISKNPVEFWQRWHMSLSRWFQDYLYFPLAMYYMRRGGWMSKYRAHLIAMGLIGFWHGANWTFIAFGLYWGCAIAGYLYLLERFGARDTTRSAQAPGRWPERWPGRWYGRWMHRWKPALSIATMFVMVCLGWILFRAESLTQVGEVLARTAAADGATAMLRPEIAATPLLWLSIGGLLLVEWLYRNRADVVPALVQRGPVSQVLRNGLLAVVLVSYLSGQEQAAQPFIYFQF